MGFCKCRKRTYLFCCVHKKSVCSNCIDEHPTCVVKTYLEWLKDSEFEMASCVVCKHSLNDLSLRLPCLDIIHPACLDSYASQLPPNTAVAGYLCPLATCQKPILGSEECSQRLRDHVMKASWSTHLRSILKPIESSTSISTSTSTSTLTAASNASSSSSSSSTSSSEPPASPSTALSAFAPATPTASDSPALYSASATLSRKGQRGTGGDAYSRRDTDDDENKYSRRRSAVQLLASLGLIQGGSTSTPIVNIKRLLLIFGALTLLVLLWVLLASSPELEAVDQPNTLIEE